MSAEEIITELPKLSRSELEEVDARLHELLRAGVAGARVHDSWLAMAGRLEKVGQVDAALDFVYDEIDEKLSSGSLDQVDRLLANPSF